MKSEEYLKLEMVVRQLRGARDKYTAKAREQSCDKHGFGFNLDGRFSAFSTKVSFDSWAGYYGNSSCSNVVNFCDTEAVRGAFVEYLNAHTLEIFEWMADHIEENSQPKREEYLASLKEEIARLEALPDAN